MGVMYCDWNYYTITRDMVMCVFNFQFQTLNLNVISSPIKFLEWYNIIQCNLDYPDLIYPETRLSGLAGHQQIHYHAYAEGVTNALCGCGYMSYGLYRLCLGQN